MLLWLWCRVAAVAPLCLLAWELPYAAGAAIKKKKKLKNKRSILICHPVCQRNLCVTCLAILRNLSRLLTVQDGRKKKDFSVLMNAVSVLRYITTFIFIPTLQESKVKQMCHLSNNN